MRDLAWGRSLTAPAVHHWSRRGRCSRQIQRSRARQKRSWTQLGATAALAIFFWTPMWPSGGDYSNIAEWRFFFSFPFFFLLFAMQMEAVSSARPRLLRHWTRARRDIVWSFKTSARFARRLSVNEHGVMRRTSMHPSSPKRLLNVSSPSV